MRIARGPVAKRSSRRKGAAAVELAVILPVLILIVLGCVDFGRFAYTYVAVTNAARTGAGYGSSHGYTKAGYPTWQALVAQAAKSEMGDFDASQITVDASAVNDSPTLWRAQVDVSYTFQTLINWPGLPSQVTLTQRVAMRNVR
jgi:Flp pilus assembly protein TadG